MGLNTMDSVLDFGKTVRLTLSAVGQIAAPLQALWIFGFVVAKLDSLQFGTQKFDSSAQVQAYRAWLIMRCRQVWPTDCDPISDGKLLAMIAFWTKYKDLSLSELLHPPRWPGISNASVSIASVLDHLIRLEPPASPKHEIDSGHEEPPTPWYESPDPADHSGIELCCDSSTVVFDGSSDSPNRFQPQCNSTIGQFLVDHEKLVGKLQVQTISLNNMPVPPETNMLIGQVFVIKLKDPSSDIEVAATVPDTVHVSPTLPWTVPAQEECIKSPPRKVSKYEVGECTIPRPEDVSETAWLDASPLLGLQGEQFLKLSPHQSPLRSSFGQSEANFSNPMIVLKFWEDRDSFGLMMKSGFTCLPCSDSAFNMSIV